MQLKRQLVEVDDEVMALSDSEDEKPAPGPVAKKAKLNPVHVAANGNGNGAVGGSASNTKEVSSTK